MDAVLLVLECVAIVLVLRWVAARQGLGGLLGWKPDAPAKTPGPTRR